MPNEEYAFAQQLEGQLCHELKVQQFFYEGRLADQWNVLFLRLARDRWVRFFFDAGVFFWKNERPTLPYRDNEYRLVTPEIAKAVEGRTVLGVAFSSLATGGRTLTIELDNQTALHLHNERDRSSVAFIGKRGSGESRT